MMKPCEVLRSNSSPFFSDVEGVVDLQVALVIIIKKLQKLRPIFFFLKKSIAL